MCKTSNKKSRISLPQHFADDLENELEQLGAHTPNDQYVYVEKVIVGQFQADLYMTGSIVSCQAMMSMTTDTNIPITAGFCCMLISRFTKNRYTVQLYLCNYSEECLEIVDQGVKNKCKICGKRELANSFIVMSLLVRNLVILLYRTSLKFGQECQIRKLNDPPDTQLREHYCHLSMSCVMVKQMR